MVEVSDVPQSWMTPMIRQSVRWCIQPALGARVPLAFQRFWLQVACRVNAAPGGVRYHRDRIAGVPVEIAVPDNPLPGAVLYLHGGAYVTCSARTHRGVTGRIARKAGCRVIAVDYRRAPEHPYPAALQDLMQVWQGLLNAGEPPRQMVFMGDSAGGGLALGAAQWLRDRGSALPAGLVLFSPWADLTLDHLHAEARDVLVTRPWIEISARSYLSGVPADTGYASPVYGDFSGLPPLLIQVSRDELLLTDARRVAEAARTAGVSVELQEFDGLWHVFQLNAGLVVEGDRALDAAARTLTHWLGRNETSPAA